MKRKKRQSDAAEARLMAIGGKPPTQIFR